MQSNNIINLDFGGNQNKLKPVIGDNSVINPDCIFTFSSKNKNTSINEIWDLYNMYIEKIKNLLSMKDKGKSMNEISYLKFPKQSKLDIQGKKNQKNISDCTVIKFPLKPKQDKDSLPSLFEITDIGNKIFGLILDFKRDSHNILSKRNYVGIDEAVVIESIFGREQVLKSHFLEGNIEECIKLDITSDFIELKDRIRRERNDFTLDSINSFFLNTKKRIQHYGYWKNRTEVCNCLDTYFLTLRFEFINIRLLELRKKYKETGESILIKTFSPIQEDLDFLHKYISQLSGDKANAFSRDFKIAYEQINELYPS